MNVLEKILEEIEEKRKGIIDMSDEEPELRDVEDWLEEGEKDGKMKAYQEIEEIIRTHIEHLPNVDAEEKSILCTVGEDGVLSEYDDTYDVVIHCTSKDDQKQTVKFIKDSNWIPVSEEVPPFGERLQATILHHEWIADYDSSWVPEEEKTHHEEYTEVCDIYTIGRMWFYSCKEDDYGRNVAYIKPKKDLGNPISEIIAWRPLPEPYCPEVKE